MNLFTATIVLSYDCVGTIGTYYYTVLTSYQPPIYDVKVRGNICNRHNSSRRTRF